MSKHSFVFAAVFALAAPVAHADEVTTVEMARTDGVGGAPGAFELTIGLGSSQAYGKAGRDEGTLNDLGAALELQLGRRVSDRWTVGAYGGFATHAAFAFEGTAFSSDAGVETTYHFMPGVRPSPWASLGLGWRGYWMPRAGERETLLGFDVLRLQVGIEPASLQGVTLSPVIGASLSTFLWQKGPGASDFSSVSDPRLSVFIFAGFKGGFDVMGG